MSTESEGEVGRDLYGFFFSASKKPVDKQKRICNEGVGASKLP